MALKRPSPAFGLEIEDVSFQLGRHRDLPIISIIINNQHRVAFGDNLCEPVTGDTVLHREPVVSDIRYARSGRDHVGIGQGGAKPAPGGCHDGGDPGLFQEFPDFYPVEIGDAGLFEIPEVGNIVDVLEVVLVPPIDGDIHNDRKAFKQFLFHLHLHNGKKFQP